MGLKTVLDQYELMTEQNARDHLVWTIGNGDAMPQDTSRMGTEWVKQDEGSDAIIIK